MTLNPVLRPPKHLHNVSLVLLDMAYPMCGGDKCPDDADRSLFQWPFWQRVPERCWWHRGRHV